MPPGPGQGPRKGPLIAAAVGAVAVIGGVIATLVIVVGGDDGKSTSAGGSTTPAASSGTEEATTSPTPRSTGMTYAPPTRNSTTTRPARTATARPTDLPEVVERVDMRVGECFDIAADGDISKKSCTTPHDYEVYKNFDIPGTTYPGEDAVIAEAESTCGDAMDLLTPRNYSLRELGVSYLYPEPEGWSFGDREVTCVAERASGQKFTEPLG